MITKQQPILVCPSGGGGAMSKQALEAILGRCLMDDDFRILLFADPDQALTGYDLTRKERTALAKVDAETLDALTERLRTLLAAPDQVARRR